MFTGSDEYCASESFDASCGQHEAILMESAHYGRMEGGRCIRYCLLKIQNECGVNMGS